MRQPNRVFLRIAVAAGALVLWSAGTARAEQPDAWITTKIKLELELVDSNHLNANAVHVDTIDGTVTLHGKVPTLAQKKRAEEVASGTDGVRVVRNLLQVVPGEAARITDEADDVLRDRLERRFKSEPLLAGTKIEIKSVNRGVVLLAGDARNLTEYLCAVETASQVHGVRSVASEVKSPNELATAPAKRGEKGTAAHDDWVTFQTKMLLMADKMVPALDVNVQTHGGTVTLFGIVPSKAARMSAVADTHRVDGALVVDDQLQVVPAARRQMVDLRDEQVQRDVKATLHGRPELAHVDVTVKDGLVRLSGTVATEVQRLTAATITRGVPGVRAVDDNLRL